MQYVYAGKMMRYEKSSVLKLMNLIYKYIFFLIVCATQLSCSNSADEVESFLDSDNDGLTDTEEINIYGTNPEIADTDGDGFDDRIEVITQSDPLKSQIIPEHRKYIRDDLDAELDPRWINKNSWNIESDLSCRTKSCLKSPLIRLGGKSNLSVDLVVNKGHFQFDIIVDNACCNKVDFYVDDIVVKTFHNGENLTSSIVLQDGLHRLAWVIDTKNNATMQGAVLLDNIRFAAFATSERNLSTWSTHSDSIFSNNLTTEASVITGNGQVVGTGVQFDAEKGVNPGGAGGLIFNDFQNSLILSDSGSITLDIEPAAISIDESENPSFTQSSGAPRTANASFFVATPTSGEANEKIQLYRHLNGNLGFWEKSNGINQAVANRALNSLGKSGYTHLGISWDGSMLEFFVDGILYQSLNRTAPATSEAFQKFYIGRYAGKNIGDYWIKNFNIYSEPIKIFKVDNTVGILGDGFTVAGFKQPFGIPRYDVSWGYQLQKYLANEGMSATFYPGGQNSHGYSLSNPQTLTNLVDALLVNDPDVVFCLGSVNDVHNGVFKEDYQKSWETIVDKLSSHPSVKKIIVTSITPFTKVQIFNSADVKQALLKSNDVISKLPAYNEKVVYFDLFSAMNGFDYDSEWSIGSASGTNDISDLHPSPKGHVKLAELLYSVIRANLE